MAAAMVNSVPAPDAVTGPQVAAVVVLHRRYDSVGTVIDGLIDQGVPKQWIVVVDNSEQPAAHARFVAGLPAEVGVLAVPNRGYGAAVNDGLARLAESGVDAPYVLVCTHEVQLGRDCVSALAAALRAAPDAAAAGPTLVTGDGEVLWSTGGRLTRFGRAPRHDDYLRPVADVDLTGKPQPRDWLDGALVLYRRLALGDHPFDERFFLYMEEVDLHLRLGLGGWQLLWVPQARARQESGGTPAYYFARNSRLLAARHQGGMRSVMQPAAQVARRMLSTVRSGDSAAIPQLWRGWRAKAGRNPRAAVILNPLGGALHHYTLELRSTLTDCGWDADVVTVHEPSIQTGGRVAWVRDYLHALVRARRLLADGDERLLVVTWPVAGYLDLLAIRTIVGHGRLVVHDPEPLVWAVGLDGVSARLGRLAAGERVQVLTHSQPARSVVSAQGAADDPALVPHPMYRWHPTASRPDRVVISVLGQYKPDRDLDLMRALAAAAEPEWDLRVVGRGWPELPGWSVDSRFVTEDEFDERIIGSTVVLIPYTRFFQSGVAIRALEHRVPFVGPRGSTLADLVGADSPLLAGPHHQDWIESIRYAATMPTEELEDVRLRYLEQAQRSWTRITAGAG